MRHGTWEPRPAGRWEDAFLSGNGRHGAMVFGDPADERVVVNHHTLVRPNGSEALGPPALAAGLPALQAALLAGDTRAAEEFGAGYPHVWVQPFHPAFQVRVRRGDAAGEPGYRRQVDFTSGQVSAMDGGWRSDVFVSRTDDVIVHRVSGRPGGLSAEVRLDERLPGLPDGLRFSRSVVCEKNGHPETRAVLSLRTEYGNGRTAFTGTTLVVVPDGRADAAGDLLRVTGASAILLLTRVERHPAGIDPGPAHGCALGALLEADPVGVDRTAPPRPHERNAVDLAYSRLLAGHLPAHRGAYLRAELTLTTDPAERELPGTALLRRPDSPALLERLFAAGRYHLLSSSGMLPPRLTGLWTGDWNTAWSGAFTTNANLNLQVASAAAGALPEVSRAHAELVRGQLADWRDNARELFGARGVVAPSHTDGESGHTRHFERAYPLHLWTAGADWLLHPLVDDVLTGGLPGPWLPLALVEVAEFYEDFLVSRGPDAPVAVVPSYSPENRPANASWGTVDATMDIAAARHALTTAADFRPDHPRAPHWRALAARLPPYRVNEDGALAEWAGPELEDTYDHRHISHLYPVWPLDEINPHDTPALAAAAHRALELRGTENDSAHGRLHTALVAARLRDEERAGRALRHVLHGDYFHDSLMSAHYPGRDVYNADAAHALPAVLIECLVQSSPGRLVLLPAVPRECAEGTLRGIRTRFGARLDLRWSQEHATAVLWPSSDRTIDVVAGGVPCPLTLVAAEKHVLSLPGRR
ncbi:glycosyl hydrolase family 95 catalytic domain-containing protein [Streptomyces sp. rh34]|uniref:glycosyl hydrolase family 95 catalytic domain-containing protein n=1 Tax=Streptomyces sp. rh34 TaxID=2034272 RepID=UPI000BF16B81|nr:glycoside hydrolase N-terminal domain-containing protein [Streptomyces sp. rh34]